jgi:16S rRNA (cytosine967-C5)-methyltransferase
MNFVFLIDIYSGYISSRFFILSRYHSYINSAIRILKTYKGQEPFSVFLKKFYSENKKFGSRDRKEISNLCYCYFRLGKAIIEFPEEEIFLVALFLCTLQPVEILKELKPEWIIHCNKKLEEKLKFINCPYLLAQVFPWMEEVNETIDQENFTKSFFIQPNLFLRLRPGLITIVKNKLYSFSIPFEEKGPDCLSLTNTTKLENIIDLDKEAVVQDFSSQQLANFYSIIENKKKLKVWDCCAASGGKSILANDILGEINLTVSDIRETILVNLKKRFSLAGIKNYKSFVIDLTKHITNKNTEIFDLIVADVPCTGSGTWSRTPEQLFYFDKKRIEEYAILQRKIISNVIPQLYAGGYFLYITCSVFKKENEDVVKYAKEKFQLQLIKMELIKGYDKKADTMFAALFRKQS